MQDGKVVSIDPKALKQLAEATAILRRLEPSV
jgi:hypothetical protein